MTGLVFLFVCCLDEALHYSKGAYWWFGDAGSCSQVISFVWVLNIWYSLGLVRGARTAWKHWLAGRKAFMMATELASWSAHQVHLEWCSRGSVMALLPLDQSSSSEDAYWSPRSPVPDHKWYKSGTARWKGSWGKAWEWKQDFHDSSGTPVPLPHLPVKFCRSDFFIFCF